MKAEVKKEKKSCPIVWILAIIGAVAAVAAIAYAAYRYFKPDYLEDFEDDFKTMIHNIASSPDTFKKFILDLWPVENGKKGRKFEFSKKLVTTLSESKTYGMKSLSVYVSEQIK